MNWSITEAPKVAEKTLIQLTAAVVTHKPWNGDLPMPEPGVSSGSPIFIDPFKIDEIWGGEWGHSYVKSKGKSHAVCESIEEIARACKNAGLKIVKTMEEMPSEPA